MNGLPPARLPLPFVSHLTGAVLFALIMAWMVYGASSTPVDLFIHHTYLSEGFVRFGVFGAVFYGFSLVLLRFCSIPNFWGLLYAVSSWLLFVVAFFPTLPFGSSGMMRRVANPADYEATRLVVVQYTRLVHTIVALSFGLVQALFLRGAWRQMRSKETALGASA